MRQPALRRVIVSAIPIALLALLASRRAVPGEGAPGEDAPARAAETAAAEPAIRASAAAFIAAFNRHDAEGLAALWTPAGSLADERGEIFKGRKAIEELYAAFFKSSPGAKISVHIRSIHFPAPTLAEEDGVAQVIVPGAEAPVASRYTALHVLQEGQWLMASVRESRVELPSNYARLKELDWLVGDWTTTRDDTTVKMGFRWIANRSFLQQTHAVTQEGVVTASGVQIIGWDPEAGKVRSWSFDSTGGFGTGLWSPTSDGYRIESRGMLANGTITSSREFLIKVDDEDHVLGWRSTDRRVGSELLPNTDEVALDRVGKP